MIDLVKGNLLEADAEALVNTVNCVGIMGKGVALQFKQAYPDNFESYAKACKDGEVEPGRMFVFETGRMVNPRFIINFPSKRHWRAESRIEDIELGLTALVNEVRRLGIQSVAVPPLGCGSGGLDWEDVRPRIEAAFAAVPNVKVRLYEPAGAPAAVVMPIGTKPAELTHARAVLLKLIQRFAISSYGLTILGIEKVAYFMQEAGEPLQLRYAPDRYGPYADNLHFPLQAMEGHFIRGYGDRTGNTQLLIVPGASRNADEILSGSSATLDRLERVGRVMEGYENPSGMELLATVHWVTRESEEAARDPEVAVRHVHAWSKRKQRLFTRQHILAAWGHLRASGWIREAAAS